MLLLGPAESPKNWARGQRSISKIRERRQRNYQEYDRRSLCFVEVKPFQYSLLLLCTLKSDKEAISSSSSLVAQEAEILACC